MVGGFPDCMINFVGFIRNNKQRLFLITLIEHLNYLGAAELVNNGIKCNRPAKESTCNGKDNDIAKENIIPCINSFLGRKINTDKIGSTGSSSNV